MLIPSILVDYEYTLIMYTIADFIKNMGFVLIKSRLEKHAFIQLPVISSLMYCTLLLNCAYYYEVQYFLFLYTFGTGFVFGQSLQDLCWPFTFRLFVRQCFISLLALHIRQQTHCLTGKVNIKCEKLNLVS